MTCPRCGSDTTTAPLESGIWQCLTCEQEWLAPTQEEGPMTQTKKYERPTELLADMYSHGITNAAILDDCSFDTSGVPTFTADETVQKIQDRGLGGELDVEAAGQTMIYGWTTATALARQFLGEDPGAAFMGRGSAYRACVDALTKAGH